MPIKFRHVDEPYGWLNNFYLHPVVINGQSWPCVESYYQAQKFTNCSDDIQTAFTHYKDPWESFNKAQELKHLRRPDWNQIKEDIMREALRVKFQDSALKTKLLETGTEPILKDIVEDSYWGIGKDGKGKNILGIMLMEIREELRLV